VRILQASVGFQTPNSSVRVSDEDKTRSMFTEMHSNDSRGSSRRLSNEIRSKDLEISALKAKLDEVNALNSSNSMEVKSLSKELTAAKRTLTKAESDAAIWENKFSQSTKKIKATAEVTDDLKQEVKTLKRQLVRRFTLFLIILNFRSIMFFLSS
jgi:chromosome segregation ATPase